MLLSGVHKRVVFQKGGFGGCSLVPVFVPGIVLASHKAAWNCPHFGTFKTHSWLPTGRNGNKSGPLFRKDLVFDVFRRNLKEWFPKGWFWRMFPRNENRNEGTFACSPGNESRNEGMFACSPGTKTRTRAHSPNPPFTKPPFCLLSILNSLNRDMFKPLPSHRGLLGWVFGFVCLRIGTSFYWGMLQRNASMRAHWLDRQIALITYLKHLNVASACLNKVPFLCTWCFLGRGVRIVGTKEKSMYAPPPVWHLRC